MADLISRQDAIARIQALLEKEKFGSEFRVPFLDAIGAIADMPSADWSPLSVDDAETELFFCLQNMVGNPTDDKALLAQMRERGLWVYGINGWNNEE
jgi:hypothetical protein